MLKQLLAGTVLAVAGLTASGAMAQAVEKVREAGATVSELARDDARLVVAYHLSLGDRAKDEHLKPLEALSAEQVYALNLAGTSISDAGLASVGKLKGLVRLHLERTAIGDEGLKHLADLPKLEYLNLYGTQVTDAGLQHLKGLTNLKKLFVWQSGVTAKGAAQLQQALPELMIVPDLQAAAEEAKAEEPDKPEEKKPDDGDKKDDKQQDESKQQ